MRETEGGSREKLKELLALLATLLLTAVGVERMSCISLRKSGNLSWNTALAHSSLKYLSSSQDNGRQNYVLCVLVIPADSLKEVSY